MTISNSPILPPAEFDKAAEKVEHELAKFFSKQGNVYAASGPKFFELCDEVERVTMSGGKRLRGVLCYFGWLVGSGGSPQNGIDEAPAKVWELATAVELLHTFALVHDDIMDNAASRRGEVTVHQSQLHKFETNSWRGDGERFGESVAILVGNMSHVFADSLLQGVPAVTRSLWDQLRVEVNFGQYLDLLSAVTPLPDGDRGRENVEQIMLLKTALYTVVRPLQLGASLTSLKSNSEMLAPETSLHDGLETFAKPAGMAFQLRDDYLDLLGSEAILGKPVGGDLREGKATLPLYWARERANAEQLKILDWVGRDDLTTNEIASITNTISETGAFVRAEAELEALKEESLEALDLLALSPEKKLLLEALVESLITRLS